MNVIWIITDTFRQDHVGAYGKVDIQTPFLDALAGKSVRFDRHYAGSLMSVPARADFATGRWTLFFMGWEPLPGGTVTVADLLASKGVHTAGMVDTPFHLRTGMNYDQGYQTFRHFAGQAQSRSYLKDGRDEHMDARAAWRFEADRNAPRTIAGAMEWLQLHYEERFFLTIDTWDPHEPWDAPDYYTERYWPDYDGEHIYPSYTRWQDSAGLTEEKARKALATYRGEITMLDAWLGRLFGLVENMGLMESTAIVFTSDHGAYFGEHDGMFGKKVMGKRPDGTSYNYLDDDPAIRLLSLLRGGRPRSHAAVRARRRAKLLLRRHLGGRRDAHGPGRHGLRDPCRGRRPVAAIHGARQFAAGPRLHDHRREV